jgi:hypothetical protein
MIKLILATLIGLGFFHFFGWVGVIIWILIFALFAKKGK